MRAWLLQIIVGGVPVRATPGNSLNWAKENGRGMDFNPTCFAHPLAASGFTLASYDEGIRNFWADHTF